MIKIMIRKIFIRWSFSIGTIILLACITSRSGTLDKHCASQRVAMLPGELITIKSTSSIVQKILILFSDLPQERGSSKLTSFLLLLKPRKNNAYIVLQDMNSVWTFIQYTIFPPH